MQSRAYDDACALIEAQARRSALAIIKRRARAYAVRPFELEALGSGISKLSPNDLVRCLNRLWGIARITGKPLRYGPDIPLTNFRAAMLYARLLRMKSMDSRVIYPISGATQ
jgi:hypothetical protein